MTGKRSVRVGILVASVTLLPTIAVAQGITGLITDVTGAVLPGVTVEAASPALIEEVRTTVTDSQGLYRIGNLRPGVYIVTYTLPGFSTVVREGIELETAFTATLNAELQVGAIEETITVTGESPVVDVQNVKVRQVINTTEIDGMPTARTMQVMAVLVPGISYAGNSSRVAQDVGGSAVDGRQRLLIHGGRGGDMTEHIEGIPQHATTGVSAGGINLDVGAVQEFSYELAATSAERTTGGIQINMIPKEGSARNSGTFLGNYTNSALQSDNSSDELRARGLGEVNQLSKVWDANASFGGPLVDRKFWYFYSGRYWGLVENVAGMHFAQDPLAFKFVPDLSRRAISDSHLWSSSLRPTWQVSDNNKVNGFILFQGRCLCHGEVSATRAPEASRSRETVVNHLEQAIWTSAINNQMLLEVGVQRYRFVMAFKQQTRGVTPGVTDDVLAVVEQTTGLNFRAHNRGYIRLDNWMTNYKVALSYVTGSHNAKIGMHLQRGKRGFPQSVNGDLVLRVRNGVPNRVQMWSTPFELRSKLNAALGIYAQDQWTVKRLTVNAGIRFDYHNSSIPAYQQEPTRFAPARDFEAISDVPNWTDLNPRVGVSFDLTGRGTTAVKATFSRYVKGETVRFAENFSPIRRSVTNATRTWNDINGDFVPDCDFLDPDPNAECGAISDRNFGQPFVSTEYNDDLVRGFGVRDNNWETSVTLEHEIVPQVSVSAAYFRRWYGNFQVTDNLAVTPGDYDPFCITAPVDARLPGGGGNEICGLFDVTPEKFGLSDRYVTFSDDFGNQTEVYNGFDVVVDARLPRGAQLRGGASTGRTTTDNCFAIDSPEVLRHCKVTPELQTQVKLMGSVPLPWSLQASSTFQYLPGREITALYVARNAEIVGSLGRNLARGARGTTSVQLIEPGTEYEDRIAQLDVRLTKIIPLGANRRFKVNFDVYNALNGNTVLTANSRFGPAWEVPTFILPGRVFKVGGQYDF